jgi:hypothetical protein
MKSDNRITILFFLNILIPSILFAQESLTYVAERDTTAHHWGSGETIVIHAGDHITTNGWVGLYLTTSDSDEYHIMIFYEESDREYRTLARDFRPLNTEDIFGNDIFIDYPMENEATIYNNVYTGSDIAIGDVNEMWVPAYYCDVLIGENRNKLIEIHQGLKYVNDISTGEMYWYDSVEADIHNGKTMFYNAVIKLGLDTHFFVKNIIKTEYGYRVDCIEPTRDERFPYICFTESEFWNRYKPGDAMTLFLYLDGDYLDIYVDGRDILLGNFVKVGREFIRQYQSLIKTNTCDLSKITSWPRRADGSMDYPPPLNMSNYVATHQTLDNLRLRDTANTSAKLVATLPKGTEVQVIETGPVTTIDGISAPWVRVTGGNGYTGWCFSGYLEEIKKPDIGNSVIESQGPDIGVAGVNQGNELILHDNKQRSLPLWALIAIIGGAVVLAGGGGLFRHILQALQTLRVCLFGLAKRRIPFRVMRNVG